MKLFRSMRLPLTALCFFSSLGIGANEPDPGQITISVARMFENIHYSHQRLDTALSQKLLRNYLEALDYNHFFFTQEDVDRFTAEWGTKLDDEILNGRTLVAYQIHDVFRQRVEARISHAKALLQTTLAFDTQDTIEINRQKSPWPANEEAAKQVWRNRVISELLQERLSNQKSEALRAEKANKAKESEPQSSAPNSAAVPTPKPSQPSPERVVGKRYDQFLKNLQEETSEDVLRTFLQCLALTYDPHSDYMNKADLEQFSINMRLALFGIGAKLRAEDGFAKIIELVPGGPALKSGKIKVGDRIVGVAQDSKEFVDCVDLKLDKVVGMIRGKKDSIVRLQLIPVDATDPTLRSVVEIRREEVKLKDEEARAEFIELTKPNGQTVKLGWIVLPSFYGDPDRSSNLHAKSTTRDVLALIQRLKQEGIQGLVMDLRRDGGGFLDEAVSLSGLFIKKGPVVQVRSWNGESTILRDKDPKLEYDGPMVVLVNRQSASASEIFAGAMQDYRRAVIVGDSKTFGKGTVQQLIELSRALPMFSSSGNDAGAAKLTIQKFYRVAGGSTQLKGVESDIVLPSIFDQPELGEDSLKDPLPYDTVNSLDFDKWDKPLHLDELRRRSEARIPLNPEFAYVQEDLSRIRARTAENKISINESVRKAEIEEDKARKEMRDQQRKASPKPKEPRAFRISLDSASKRELIPIRFVESKEEKESKEYGSDKGRSLNSPFDIEEPPTDSSSEPVADKDGKLVVKASPFRFDPVKTETFNILADLIELSKTEQPTTVRKR